MFYKPTYEVNVQRDVIYGYGLSHDSFNLENPKQIPLKLDIYTPKASFSLLLIDFGFADFLHKKVQGHF